MKSNGKGSIIALEKKPKAKCRYWQLRVSVGKNPHTGKYQTKTRRVRGTYTEAVHALDAFKQELGGMQFTKPDEITLSALSALYLEARAHGAHGTRKVAKSTLDKDRWNINALIKAVGNAPIKDVSADAVRDALAQLMDDGASGTYARGVHATLKGLFAFAERQAYAPADVTRDVPAPKADTKPRRALEPERLAQLLNALNPADRMQFAVLMLATTGLRRAELCSAMFGDIEGDVLHVRHSKTVSGLRDVPLDAYTLSAVKARRSHLNATVGAFGLTVTCDTPLLANEIGEPPTPHHLGVWWQKHRAEYGLGGWTLHELRHSFISLLSESGASVAAMQALAGHANPATTLKVYTHAGNREKREAMESAFALLGVQGK